MDNEVIKEGQWKGWTRTAEGFQKAFGPKGQNPLVYATQGMFEVFDENGRPIGKRFLTLKEALAAVGIKK